VALPICFRPLPRPKFQAGLLLAVNPAIVRKKVNRLPSGCGVWNRGSRFVWAGVALKMLPFAAPQDARLLQRFQHNKDSR
jgi:hypothetical protein